jgi:hypothetical protein
MRIGLNISKEVLIVIMQGFATRPALMHRDVGAVLLLLDEAAELPEPPTRAPLRRHLFHQDE